jgi:hypothetical protein
MPRGYPHEASFFATAAGGPVDQAARVGSWEESVSVRSKIAAHGILKRIRDESLLIAVTAASS